MAILPSLPYHLAPHRPPPQASPISVLLCVHLRPLCWGWVNGGEMRGAGGRARTITGRLDLNSMCGLAAERLVWCERCNRLASV
jgi:hypothetical protein